MPCREQKKKLIQNARDVEPTDAKCTQRIKMLKKKYDFFRSTALHVFFFLFGHFLALDGMRHATDIDPVLTCLAFHGN